MSLLLDANVLVALAVVDHVHHNAAATWLSSADSFATCPITQGALVRYLLRAGSSAREAIAVLESMTIDRRHTFWADDLSFDAINLTGVVGHRQVTDAYLAALARSRRGSLVTLDAGLLAAHADVALAIPQ